MVILDPRQTMDSSLVCKTACLLCLTWSPYVALDLQRYSVCLRQNETDSRAHHRDSSRLVTCKTPDHPKKSGFVFMLLVVYDSQHRQPIQHHANQTSTYQLDPDGAPSSASSRSRRSECTDCGQARSYPVPSIENVASEHPSPKLGAGRQTAVERNQE